ncbi:MAG: hypothetical protein ACRESP_13240 [Pseudomonas sp.]
MMRTDTRSVLDAANEARCHQLLKQTLPQTILISIGHNAALERFHWQVLELHSGVQWVHRKVKQPV